MAKFEPAKEEKSSEVRDKSGSAGEILVKVRLIIFFAPVNALNSLLINYCFICDRRFPAAIASKRLKPLPAAHKSIAMKRPAALRLLRAVPIKRSFHFRSSEK